MKDAHYRGWKSRKAGKVELYYCPCQPLVCWESLDPYDLHYELRHQGGVLRELIG